MGSDMNSAVLGAGIIGPAMEDISAARPALGAPLGSGPPTWEEHP
jgi:hypothetical protein